MTDNNIDFQELLKRVEQLEKENHSLRAEVEELKTNDIEIKSELNTINRFISAMTECQSIDEIMTEIESTAKQLTNSDKVTFFCMDSTNEKFFAEDDGRSWQSADSNEILKNVFDRQEIKTEGTTAYIPLVSGNGNTLGVIEAECQAGFDGADLDRNFSKGGTFVENVKLGLEKENQHQGRITDELTKMFNRQGLNEYLENTVVKAIAEGKSVNILMSDIDHFKNVNDTYGHDAGDIILKGTADVLKDFTKDGASNCFRIGGEEMVTILITDTPEQAIDQAEQLRRNVEQNINEVMHEGKPLDISVTVSIGIHEIQPDSPFTKENAQEVFKGEYKQADIAVYEAKETGRNKVVCADEHNYMSYLAVKATEVFIKAEGIEDKGAINDVADMISDTFVSPTEEQGLDTIVDALRTYSLQTSDTMPDISELADVIADKIEAFAEKNAPIQETVIESEIDIPLEMPIENDSRIHGDNVFEILGASTPQMVLSVEQNGCTEYLRTDKPLQDFMFCCMQEKPFMAIVETAGEHISEADFASDNQTKNSLAVEFNFDENTITANNNDFTASIPLDKAVSDVKAVFPPQSPYFSGKTELSEKITDIKEWSDKAISKVEEKSKQQENNIKRDGGAR